MLRRRLMAENSPLLDPVTGRGIVDGYEVVDLGLPSGLLWATCNVGASSEEEHGSYYSYGSGIDEYTSNGSSYYTGTENPLDSSVDTAQQSMGGGFRMPTKEEFEELINNTNSSWGAKGTYYFKFTNPKKPDCYVLFPVILANYLGNGIYTYGTTIWTATPYGDNYEQAYRAYLLFYTNSSAVVCVVNSLSRTARSNVRGVISRGGGNS